MRSTANKSVELSRGLVWAKNYGDCNGLDWTGSAEGLSKERVGEIDVVNMGVMTRSSVNVLVPKRVVRGRFWDWGK